MLHRGNEFILLMFIVLLFLQFNALSYVAGSVYWTGMHINLHTQTNG